MSLAQYTTTTVSTCMPHRELNHDPFYDIGWPYAALDHVLAVESVDLCSLLKVSMSLVGVNVPSYYDNHTLISVQFIVAVSLYGTGGTESYHRNATYLTLSPSIVYIKYP